MSMTLSLTVCRALLMCVPVAQGLRIQKVLAAADCVLANFAVGVGDSGPALRTVTVSNFLGGLAYISMRSCHVYDNFSTSDALFFQGTLTLQNSTIDKAVKGKYNVSANANDGAQGVDIMFSEGGELLFWSREEEVWVASQPLPSDPNTPGHLSSSDPFFITVTSVRLSNVLRCDAACVVAIPAMSAFDCGTQISAFCSW